jgi:hypothetical protein
VIKEMSAWVVFKGVHKCSRMCMGCVQGNECISAQGCAWVVFKGVHGLCSRK